MQAKKNTPTPTQDVTDLEFHFLKRRLKEESPQNEQLQAALFQAWKSITEEEYNSLVMSVSCQSLLLQARDVNKLLTTLCFSFL